MKQTYLFLFFLSLLLLRLPVLGQDGTRNTNVPINKDSIGKIMIIPFEPKMLMSEIDRDIYMETKWNSNQIHEYFRHQLNAQLKIKFNKIAPTVSFYADSIKMAKDLNYIYQSTTLSYDLVDKSKKSSATTENKNGIKNGQLTVEIDTDEKFMNKKIIDPKLINYLNNKYKTNYFIFINELDIKNDAESYDLATDSYSRIITVHYSIIDRYSKTIKAGIINSTFSSKINNPKKISAQNFSEIATKLSTLFIESFNP